MFFWGGRGRFAPKKGVMLHPRATDFQENFFLDDLLNYTTLMFKFCTNKRIWASLLRQVCFFWGGRRHFALKKGVTLHPRATDFRGKKAVFFWGGKGAFHPKKGCNAPSVGYRFPRKLFLDDLLNYTTLMLKF